MVGKYAGEERRKTKQIESHIITVSITLGVMFLGFMCSLTYSINNTVVQMRAEFTNAMRDISQNKSDALQAIGENRAKINDMVNVINNHETRITLLESKRK